MFITSFGEQNITYKCCSNFLIHLYTLTILAEEVLTELGHKVKVTRADSAFDPKEEVKNIFGLMLLFIKCQAGGWVHHGQ